MSNNPIHIRLLNRRLLSNQRGEYHSVFHKQKHLHWIATCPKNGDPDYQWDILRNIVLYEREHKCLPGLAALEEFCVGHALPEVCNGWITLKEAIEELKGTTSEELEMFSDLPLLFSQVKNDALNLYYLFAYAQAARKLFTAKVPGPAASEETLNEFIAGDPFRKDDDDEDDEPTGLELLEEQVKSTSLKHPELLFPYEAIPTGRLKKIVDKACEGGVPAGLVVPALLAIASAIPVKDRMDGNRINFFVVLLGRVGCGKDTAIDRVLRVLGVSDDESFVEKFSPTGGRNILAPMIGMPATKDNPFPEPGKSRLVYICPELDEIFKPGKMDGSNVLEVFQKLYDHNVGKFVDKRGTMQRTDCRLSFLSAKAVGDDEVDAEKFRDSFGDATSGGTLSRLVFGFYEGKIMPSKIRNWEVEPQFHTQRNSYIVETDYTGPIPVEEVHHLVDELRKFEVLGFAPGLEEEYQAREEEIFRTKDWSGRDSQHLQKMAVLLSLLQGDAYIQKPIWELACRMSEWQGRIREFFQASKARKISMGEFNEKIALAVKDNILRYDSWPAIVKKKNFKLKGSKIYVRWNYLYNKLNWHSVGWDADKAIDSMVRGGKLSYIDEPRYDDNGKEIPGCDKKWITG